MPQPIRATVTLVLLALLWFPGGGTAQAQRRFPRDGGRRPGLRRALNQELGLSDHQKQQILQIKRQHANNPDKRQMWRQSRGVLTREQFERLKQIRRGQ